MPIFVLYYGGHSHDIRNQSDKNCFSESTGSFHNGQFTLCFVSYIKKQNYVCERKIVEKRGQKKGYFCPYKWRTYCKYLKSELPDRLTKALSSFPNCDIPSLMTVVHKTDSHQNGLTKPLFLWCKVKGISRNQK